MARKIGDGDAEILNHKTTRTGKIVGTPFAPKGWDKVPAHETVPDAGTVVVGKSDRLGDEKRVAISPPRIEIVRLAIRGVVPYVQNRFGQKAMNMMKEKQAAGSVAKKGTKREAKDFDECYRQAMHVSEAGWCGIPAPAFRNAAVDACRLVGFKMTHAKLGIFVLADGFDIVDGTPLVKITVGEPHKVEHAVRNDSGVADIRARPMWSPGWEAEVAIQYDADMFTQSDVVNLMHRVGMQVGIGEGRPNSKESCGMGWGLFEIIND